MRTPILFKIKWGIVPPVVLILLLILLLNHTSTSFTMPVSLPTNVSGTNGILMSATDYWAEDHPYKNQSLWKRLPNGKVVANNDSGVRSFANFRDAVEAKTPWISRWVLSPEGRHTLKKDIPRLLMYNLVSPMDYGKSIRSDNVRRRRNKAIGMFAADNLALPLIKSLGRVAWNLIQKHYVGYFEDELFTQRLKLMNSSEIIKEFNLTLSDEAIANAQEQEDRPNTTCPFIYDGESQRSAHYAQYTSAFVPYEGYSDQYYTQDDLPPPTFPADSYPWLWSSRIATARALVSQLIQSLDTDNEDVDEILSVSCAPKCVQSTSTRSSRMLVHQLKSSFDTANNSSIPLSDRNLTQVLNKNISQGEKAMKPHDMKALDQIQVRLQEFYFDTGIPRLTSRSNTSHSIFMSLAEFLQEVNSANGGDLSDSSFDDEKDIELEMVARSQVYTALTHFYSYLTVDKDPNYASSKRNASSVNCSIDQPCLLQSGVTVYTPSLTTMPLLQSFADTNLNSSFKRELRLKALKDSTQVAFEAEQRALKHGLQGPSTVWFSTFDRDVDEFADALLGTINLSIREDPGPPSPLHVYEKHMNGRVAIFDELVSYYADTNHETIMLMKQNRSIVIDVFEKSDLIQLIDFMTNQVKILEQSIHSYVQTRATNPVYQEVVNATLRKDTYNGSEYTLIEYGFVLPATNDKNVLFRDMKLPIPFHLILRLVVRFQESQLLLPQESRQLLICLAMALNHLSFYRCRPSKPSSNE